MNTPVGMPNLDKFIEKHEDGAILNLSIKPDCTSIVFPAGFNKWRNRVEMQVKSPAKNNQANKDVIKTLSTFFETPLNSIYVVSGAKKRNKTILIKGVTPKFVTSKLRESSDGL